MDDMQGAWVKYVPYVAGMLRSALQFGGGIGFTWALTVNDNHIQMAASLLVSAAAFLWGQWQKRQAKVALQKAADAPAYAPVPKLPA